MPRKRKQADCSTSKNLSESWELPYVTYFLKVYKKLFHLKKNFTTEGLQKELSYEDVHHQFEEEIIKVVEFLTGDKYIEVSTWESIVEEHLDNIPSLQNPLKNATFAELPSDKRLQLLKTLVDLVLKEKEEELEEYESNLKNKDPKFQPIGNDKDGNKYWSFGGDKLFKESSKQDSENKLAVVCRTIDEWEKLISNLKPSNNKQEKNLLKRLKSISKKLKTRFETCGTEPKDATSALNKEIEEKSVKPKKPKMAAKTDKKTSKNKDPSEQPVVKEELDMKKLEDDSSKKKKKKKKKDKSEMIDKSEKSDKSVKSAKTEKSVKSEISKSVKTEISVKSEKSVKFDMSEKPEKPRKKPKKEFSKEENIPPTKSELNKEKKMPVKQPEVQFQAEEEPLIIPRDDGPGLDLSIFEPRGKRKCVIELEERKETKKAWWEGEDEIENNSDHQKLKDDEDESFSDDTEAPKKKKRKKSTTVKVKKLPEPPKPIIPPPNRAYVFSTALADRAAHAVLQKKFNSITAFHRAQSWATPYLQANIHCIPFKPEEIKPPKQEESRSSTPDGFVISGRDNSQSDSEESKPRVSTTISSTSKPPVSTTVAPTSQQDTSNDQIRVRVPGERDVVLNDWQRYQMMHLSRQMGHPLRMEEFHKYLYRGGGGIGPGMPPKGPYMPRMPPFGPPPLRGLIRPPEVKSNGNETAEDQLSEDQLSEDQLSEEEEEEEMEEEEEEIEMEEEEEDDQRDSGIPDEKEHITDDDMESDRDEEKSIEDTVLYNSESHSIIQQPVTSQNQETIENGPISPVDSLSSNPILEEALPSPKIEQQSRYSPKISAPASPPNATSPSVDHVTSTNDDCVSVTTTVTPVRQESTPVRQESTPVRQESTPVRQESPPIRQESTIPMRQESIIPIRQESTIPMRQESTIPMRQESTIPMRQESTIPMRQGSTTPMRQESTTPMRQESTTPMRQESIAPMRQESPRIVPVTIDLDVPASTSSNTPVTISTSHISSDSNANVSQLSPFAGYRGRPTSYPADVVNMKYQADIVNVKSQTPKSTQCIPDLKVDKPHSREASPKPNFVDLAEAQKNLRTRPNSLDLKNTDTSELRDYMSRFGMPNQPNHINHLPNNSPGGVLRSSESAALNRHFNVPPAISSHAVNPTLTPGSPIMPHSVVSSIAPTNSIASPIVSNFSRDSPRPLSHPGSSPAQYSRPVRSPAPLQHPPRQVVSAPLQPTSPSFMSNSVISAAVSRIVTSPSMTANSTLSQASPRGQPSSPAVPYNHHAKGPPTHAVSHLGSYTAQDMARIFQGQTLPHSLAHSQESARKLQGLAYPFQEKGHSSHDIQRGLHGLIPGHHEASRTAQEIAHSLQGSARQSHGLPRTSQELTRSFPGHTHSLHASTRAVHDSLHTRAMHDGTHSIQLHDSSVGRGIHENPLSRTAHDAIHSRGLHDTSHARLSRAIHEVAHGRTLHDITHAPSHAGLAHPSYQQHLRNLQGNHSSHSPSSMPSYLQNRDFTSPSGMKGSFSSSPTVQPQTSSEQSRKSFSVESLSSSEANDRSKYPFYNGQSASAHGTSSRPGHGPSQHAQHMFAHMRSLGRGPTPEFFNLPPHVQQMYASSTGMNPFMNYPHHKGL